MNWTEDVGVEDVMRQLGLDWEVSRVKMSEIDVKQSRANFAREDRLDKDHAESIAIAARNGYRIPMCVVRAKRLPNGKIVFVIASGNHRHESALTNGELEMPCYVVACTDGEFEMLCKLANTTPGKGAGHSLRAKQAAQAVISKRLSEAEAASLFGVPKSAVNKQKRLILADEKLISRTGRPLRVSQDVKLALANIQADSVFNQAVAYASQAGLSQTDAASAIRAAQAKPEHEAIEYLKSQIEQNKPQKIGSVHRSEFMRALSLIEGRVSKYKTLDAADIPQEMQPEVRERCLAIASYLRSL